MDGDLSQERVEVHSDAAETEADGAFEQLGAAETEANGTLDQAENDARLERPQRTRRKPARYRDENFV